MGVAIFASQNLSPVSISFLWFQSIPLPLGLVLISCGGLGGVCLTVLQEMDWSLPQLDFSPQRDTTYRYVPPRAQPPQDDWQEPWDDDWE
ncbi:MAG: LapA family protein [Pseudanabaenaceae cyanobacterium SKYGB_i_bin29]|nr:LapA family protein [Pseudanabaenaceae cyanobacterium SKYG29]MDW8421621.1 LapA family protein [Pseudanabaenaceae cyanobacterium SKYGB_i_bin29]